MSITKVPLKTMVIDNQINQEILKTRIVHIGFGAFHRAHQALYTSEMIEKNQSDWGICEVDLFSGRELIKKLRLQNHRYLVAEKGANENTIKMVGSIKESLHPELDSKQAILEKMAEEQVAIISMTITEKGYCADHSTGLLDQTNSLIIHDLQNPSEPHSAIGYIVEALRLRRERGINGFSIMSCDNVQENGHIAKAAILGFASLLDADLAKWIENNASFPCTMVDRIVPAVTPETLNEIEALSGINDPCAVACEPFRQWVIEDNFVQGRPDWNIVGAEFVEDVVPFEEMKLRMLNGSHSFLAYLGYLGGYTYISDAMTNEAYRNAALEMMLKMQAITLNMPEGTNLEEYAYSLIERFTNPSLKHQTWQIAADGSQKIPQRFGASLQFHLEHNSSYKWIVIAIAGWMQYVKGLDEKGNTIDVRDPLVKTFAEIYAIEKSPEEIVKAFLSIESIFDQSLLSNTSFVETLTNTYILIGDQGANFVVSEQ
ncbi:fructuronate reductase [Psychromonas sp. RZ22]|uniref:mannitol dehydrogenase family protein n=1 Tax=Psychromonas algarum TaxID=2555643 RepID=UPI0010688B9A|nr:fructuronate reductase [Psychromonas sp. RZ22]TEW54418.1 fructuronate reductase [Psychromonas sp. RZ22]